MVNLIDWLRNWKEAVLQIGWQDTALQMCNVFTEDECESHGDAELMRHAMPRDNLWKHLLYPTTRQCEKGTRHLHDHSQTTVCLQTHLS